VANVIPSEQRTENWVRKYNAARIKDMIDEGKATFTQHASQRFVELEQMELAVKQVLDSSGVQPKDVPDYLNFGRQLWKACRKFSGSLLSNKAAIVLGRWTAEGLTASVLEAIRNEVFHIPAPTPA